VPPKNMKPRQRLPLPATWASLLGIIQPQDYLLPVDQINFYAVVHPGKLGPRRTKFPFFASLFKSMRCSKCRAPSHDVSQVKGPSGGTKSHTCSILGRGPTQSPSTLVVLNFDPRYCTLHSPISKTKPRSLSNNSLRYLHPRFVESFVIKAKPFQRKSCTAPGPQNIKHSSRSQAAVSLQPQGVQQR
jgi:hypothetical protein